MSGAEAGRPEPEFILPQERVRIAALADLQVPIFAYLSRDAYTGAFPISFTVRDSASGRKKTANGRFRGP
jgi:hypothetical protein